MIKSMTWSEYVEHAFWQAGMEEVRVEQLAEGELTNAAIAELYSGHPQAMKDGLRVVLAMPKELRRRSLSQLAAQQAMMPM